MSADDESHQPPILLVVPKRTLKGIGREITGRLAVKTLEWTAASTLSSSLLAITCGGEQADNGAPVDAISPISPPDAKKATESADWLLQGRHHCSSPFGCDAEHEGVESERGHTEARSQGYKQIGKKVPMERPGAGTSTCSARRWMQPLPSYGSNKQAKTSMLPMPSQDENLHAFCRLPSVFYFYI